MFNSFSSSLFIVSKRGEGGKPSFRFDVAFCLNAVDRADLAGDMLRIVFRAVPDFFEFLCDKMDPARGSIASNLCGVACTSDLCSFS